MNAKPTSNYQEYGVAEALGVLVLILGTATGNAFAMLAMALVDLAVIAVLYRKELGRIEMLVTAVAVAAASLLVAVIASL